MANTCSNNLYVSHNDKSYIDQLELCLYIGYFFPSNQLPPLELVKKEIKNPTIIRGYNFTELLGGISAIEDLQNEDIRDDETLTKEFGYCNILEYCENTYDNKYQFPGYDTNIFRDRLSISVYFCSKWRPPYLLIRILNKLGYNVENYSEVNNELELNLCDNGYNERVCYDYEFELKKWDKQKLHDECDERLLSYFEKSLYDYFNDYFLEEYNELFDYFKLSHDPDEWSDSEEKLLYLCSKHDEPLKAAKIIIEQGLSLIVDEWSDNDKLLFDFMVLAA